MLIKQIDGCAVGGPISVVLSDIYVCKIEENIVGPSKPLSTSVMWIIHMSEEKRMRLAKVIPSKTCFMAIDNFMLNPV